jgi:hypothetical protein
MKTDKFNLFFSITLLLLILIINNNKKYDNFFIDYSEAKLESLKQNKLLFICFNSSLSNQEISDFKKIKNNYIVCILDLEKDKEVFDKYNIKEIPTYAIIDPVKKEICIEEGHKEKKKLFEWLNQFRKN